MENNLHVRHRLPRAFYLGLGSYFLTLCTRDRRKLFTSASLVGVLVGVMREEFDHAGFSVGAYCFMPDHCHILSISRDETSDLAQAVRAFKGVSATRARGLNVRSLWQRDYYDHALRSGEGLEFVASYIFANPVRAGLAKDAHAWPFSGSFVFEWRLLPSPPNNFVPSWKNQV